MNDMTEPNDWADDMADMTLAHRVEVAWIAYDERGNVLFNSDAALTASQAVGMFQGIAETKEN